MLINSYDFFKIYNLIYFCVACWVVVSALSIEIKKDKLLQNKLGGYLTVLVLLFLTILVGFREYDVGTDTINYYNYLWLGESKVNFSNEFLFNLITFLLKEMNLNYNYFLLFISSIFYYFLYKALKNYADYYKVNLFFIFFTFLSFFFFLSMSINVIRQGVSLVILLLAYSLFCNNSADKRIFILIALALGFHSTSIIPFLIFLLSLIFLKINKIYFFVLIYFFSIFLSYYNFGLNNFSALILNFLGESRRSSYFLSMESDYEIGFKTNFVLFNTFFLILSLHIRNKLLNFDIKKNYDTLIIYYIVSSIFLFMAFQLPFSDRWGLFSWIVIPFLVAPIFYSPYIKGGIKLHFIFIFIFIFIGFKFYV